MFAHNRMTDEINHRREMEKMKREITEEGDVYITTKLMYAAGGRQNVCGFVGEQSITETRTFSSLVG